MSVKELSVPVPAHFAMRANLYAQGRDETHDRSITAPPAEMLAFAFRILEQVFATTAGLK